MTRQDKALRGGARLLAAASLASLLASPAAIAEERVTAMHVFPTNLIYTKTFLAIVDDINERGKGVVRIDVLGGPEAIGMFQQPAAARDGVVDMVHVPGSFYGANVPEIDAMVGATVTPMEARAKGGTRLLDQAHQQRFNVRFLGWIDGGVKFHIYMANQPKFGADGVLDLTGVKLRDNPIYTAFFKALKATTASLPATEVYSALEKGVVDAAAWTQIGLMDLKWDKFLKWRVDPAFYTTDIGIIFNLDRWRELSPEAQRIIEETIIEWEEKSYNDRQADVARELAELERRGMKVAAHSEEGARKYLALADEAVWGRMKERLAAMGDTTSYDKLRAIYHP
ncbi:MAG: hypothetical protein KatS3mg118_3165 [Paracoccaceae bacterium]|nr:MAG: hypothetical protein KatS3mg118_3165 [Paracoccaceae bacterium]